MVVSTYIFNVIHNIIFQSNYLEPTIFQEWEVQQQSVLDTLGQMEGGLSVAGDGRCDSPGHCAKYGYFTLIDCRINKVVDFQLVQVKIV